MKMTIYSDRKVSFQHCQHFVEGLTLLKDEAVPQALLSFKCAYQQSPADDFYHKKYASFLGLAQVLTGDLSGVELCRIVASCETFDGDVFLNLAYVEWFMHNRQRSVYIMEKGLRVDRQHPGLNKFKQCIGERRRKAIDFFPRNNFVNVALGKLVRQKMVSGKRLEYSELF